MGSLKAKLISVVAMICLVVGVMLVGIFAAETQQIKLNGQVNFEIADKSLYVKDVRMQEDMDASTIYSLKDSDRFMPGYVNDTFNMNLGDFINTYGSFALYFDIINTMDEISGETFVYNVESTTTQSGVTVTTAILDTNGSNIDQIPQGTVKPSEITSSTPISATIKVTVSGTAGASIDLSQITITINQYIKVYDYFDFEINSDGKSVTLTNYDSSLADTTDIVIPATVSQNESGEWIEGDTYTVTDILSATSTAYGVFHSSGITSIELPLTLETIGSFAFYNCDALTEIDLSNCTSLTSIESRVFEDCSGLTSITLPSSLTSIGRGTFSGCTNLQPSATDQGVKYLGNSDNQYLVLWNGTGITTSSYIVNEDCKFIYYNAFREFSGLTSIDLSKCTSLISIGEHAFDNCSGLTGALDLSNCTSLISIERYAFFACSELTGELDISNCTRLESIGEGAFMACSGFTGVLNLTNCTSLTSIGDSAFEGCSGLEVLALGESLTSIGEAAFNSCIGLTELDFSNCTSLISIGYSAFNYCSGLTEVDLSNCTSLTSIGSYAFELCTSLKRIVFPNTTGWYRTMSSTDTSGTNMTMTNPTNNATWLTDTYVNYYFKRNA